MREELERGDAQVFGEPFVVLTTYSRAQHDRDAYADVACSIHAFQDGRYRYWMEPEWPNFTIWAQEVMTQEAADAEVRQLWDDVKAMLRR